MKLMKIFLPLIVLFGLNGCVSSTSSYYILSVALQPQKIYPTQRRVIGVEKVIVPGYLYKREIAIADSPSHITLLGTAQWGEDLDSGLTNRLIGYLQKKFNQPDVYMYPWGIDKQPDIKVSVHVTRFIAQGDSVYLDATWSVESVKIKKRVSRLFSTKVATKSDVQSIVHSMDAAFAQFEETVAVGIKNF
ncbi:MAG: membrane integrity-associated transporter subunit PqiC [Epsilonproteobacteria bacterium]|nr:membrane integrity-associated transporter subunit PqiC [Campylobacterota bacterium]